MSVQVSYKKQFVLGFLLFLIVLLIVELFSIIYVSTFIECYFLKNNFTEHDKNILKQMCVDYSTLSYSNNELLQLLPNQHSESVNVNNFGFRGDDISEKKISDKRIFMVGGSTMFGAGASSDITTIPGHLQTMFDDSSLDVEIVNAGLPSAYSKTEALYVENFLLKFEPDIIVIYDGWNDLRYSYEKHMAKKDFRSNSNQFMNDLNQLLPFYKTLVVAKYFGYNFLNLFDHNVYYPQSNLDKKIDLWEERWKNICKIGNNNNFQVVISLQPILGSGNKTFSEYENHYFSTHDGLDLHVNALKKYGDKLYELDQHCTLTIDLQNTFDNVSNTVYFDGGHMSGFGNKIIAKIFYDNLLPLLK
jgi:hypothetical protein